ncbi:MULTISPECIES: hypothetical protein [Bosea]|uniref:hypothetical protein n=1 Tax=Bosea TaxID=85413 RepID=UPI0011136945|nr:MULTISPECIES: hypothetical protein [Bosea]
MTNKRFCNRNGFDERDDQESTIAPGSTPVQEFHRFARRFSWTGLARSSRGALPALHSLVPRGGDNGSPFGDQQSDQGCDC